MGFLRSDSGEIDYKVYGICRGKKQSLLGLLARDLALPSVKEKENYPGLIPV